MCRGHAGSWGCRSNQHLIIHHQWCLLTQSALRLRQLSWCSWHEHLLSIAAVCLPCVLAQDKAWKGTVEQKGKVMCSHWTWTRDVQPASKSMSAFLAIQEWRPPFLERMWGSFPATLFCSLSLARFSFLMLQQMGSERIEREHSEHCSSSPELCLGPVVSATCAILMH